MNGTDKKEGWPEWTAKLLHYIADGDMEAAANMLACCTKDERDGPADITGRSAMFKHPRALEHAKVLWGHMRPLVTSCYRRGVRKDLVAAGWVLD